MAGKFFSKNPNTGYDFTTKQDITNYFNIITSNYNTDVYSKYNLKLESKNSNLSLANVNLGYKIGDVDLKNYVSAPYIDYTSGETTFSVVDSSSYKMMSIVLVGGGGSGGSGVNTTPVPESITWSDYGGIGGSGAVYISDYIINSSTDSYSVTIGQGGSSVRQTSYDPSDGVDGNSGGNTTFTNTTKNWYITAGGGGGGGKAVFRWRGGSLSTSPGSGGTTWDSGTNTNFTNN